MGVCGRGVLGSPLIPEKTGISRNIPEYPGKVITTECAIKHEHVVRLLLLLLLLLLVAVAVADSSGS